MKILHCLIAICMLAGCSEDKNEWQTDPGKPPTTMIYSPNGEPLNGGPLGTLTCDKAMAGWFDRMRTNDAISADAFAKDAAAQFARMDIDHNGYIVSEELDRFREPYRQQPPALSPDSEDNPQKRFGKHKADHLGHSDPTLSMSDPVMSADTNLDFKVTPDEFAAQSRRVFTMLDADHDGQLSRAEVMDACAQQAGAKPRQP